MNKNSKKNEVAPLPPKSNELDGRLAIVTGAASGLGFATASALAARGAHVILADCDAARAQSALATLSAEYGQNAASVMNLDLSDLASVKRFADQVSSNGKAVDILVNNAGILPPAKRAATADGFERMFGIGYLGHFALTGLLLPMLLKSKAPRVINVSSLVHAHGRIDFDDINMERSYQAQRAYSQTKLACLMFALELQRRADLSQVALFSAAAHPGVARTSIGAARRAAQSKSLRDRLEIAAMDFLMRWFGQSAAAGAAPIVFAATSAAATGGAFYGPDGFMQFAGQPTRVSPSPAALDVDLCGRLWKISEALTGIRYSWREA